MIEQKISAQQIPNTNYYINKGFLSEDIRKRKGDFTEKIKCSYFKAGQILKYPYSNVSLRIKISN